MFVFIVGIKSWSVIERRVRIQNEKWVFLYVVTQYGVWYRYISLYITIISVIKENFDWLVWFRSEFSDF